jgi:hypothetical protein
MGKRKTKADVEKMIDAQARAKPKQPRASAKKQRAGELDERVSKAAWKVQ